MIKHVKITYSGHADSCTGQATLMCKHYHAAVLHNIIRHPSTYFKLDKIVPGDVGL